MTQVDSSRTIHATTDAVWRVVSDPSRLAEWVPTAQTARSADADDVHLEGESHGHSYSVTSPFHADEIKRRLDWSAPGVPGYAGSLQLTDRGDTTEVAIQLTIPDEKLPASKDVVAEIRRGTDEALDRLGAIVAG